MAMAMASQSSVVISLRMPGLYVGTDSSGIVTIPILPIETVDETGLDALCGGGCRPWLLHWGCPCPGATQPTVSARVGNVEEVVGGPLFARSTRRVVLTELGIRLVPRLRTVLTAEQEVYEELDHYRHPRCRCCGSACPP